MNKPTFQYMHKGIATIVLVAFLSTSIKTQVYADPMPWMPKPGGMVSLSQGFTPANLKGIVIHPENALKFDFIVERGDEAFSDNQKKQEYTKLIKYFLASLAVPDDDQWVNLSPYEKDRIIKDNFGKTEMGRDLLAQDYLLKQITSSMIYPKEGLGKKFWDKVYSQSQAQYGTTNIPVNTFNKVWIVPDEAQVYEKGNAVFLIKSHLKVMLEEDYLSLQKHSGLPNRSSNVTSSIVKEIVLPALEKEVNEGKHFASLRQVISGMILAEWYKRALKESLLAKIYADKSKLKGIDQNPKTNEEIYQQYLQAYKKGVFNFIKDDINQYTKQSVPRKYFSGGIHPDPSILTKVSAAVGNSAMSRILSDPAMETVVTQFNTHDVAMNDLNEIVSRFVAENAPDLIPSERIPEDHIHTPEIDKLANLRLELQRHSQYLLTEGKKGRLSPRVESLIQGNNETLIGLINVLNQQIREAEIAAVMPAIRLLRGKFTRTTGDRDVIDGVKIGSSSYRLSVSASKDLLTIILRLGDVLVSNFSISAKDEKHIKDFNSIRDAITAIGPDKVRIFLQDDTQRGSIAAVIKRELNRVYPDANVDVVKYARDVPAPLITDVDVPLSVSVYQINDALKAIAHGWEAFYAYVGRPSSKDKEGRVRYRFRMDFNFTDDDYSFDKDEMAIVLPRFENVLVTHPLLKGFGFHQKLSVDGETVVVELTVPEPIVRDTTIGESVYKSNVQIPSGMYRFVMSSRDYYYNEFLVNLKTIVDGESDPAKEDLNIRELLENFIFGMTELLHFDHIVQGKTSNIKNDNQAPRIITNSAEERMDLRDGKGINAAMTSREIKEDGNKAMKGGIDLNGSLLDFQIKRDGAGAPLSFSQQDMSQLSHLDGLVPVIVEIKSTRETPLLSQLQSAASQIV